MGDWQSVLFSVAFAAPMALVLLGGSWWYHFRVRSRISSVLLWSAVAYFVVQVPVLAVLLLMQPYEGQPLFDLFLGLEFAQAVAGVVTGLIFAVALIGVLRESVHVRGLMDKVQSTESDGSAEPT
jgi:hypothetical protein